MKNRLSISINTKGKIVKSPMTEGWEWIEPSNKFADDAIVLFSKGQYEDAKNILTQHLTECRGETDKVVWLLLLDAYQLQSNKLQFEKVAEMFAKRFKESPPSFYSKQKEDIFFSGRNVIVLDGELNQDVADKAKDFIRSSRDKKTGKIDCSRLDVEKSKPEGLYILLDTMQKLRKHKVQVLLMGENSVVEALKVKVKSTENHVYWLLMFELLQWKGMEETFEDMAYQFAVKFDISPPGFDPDGMMKLPTQQTQQQSWILPKVPNVLSEGSMNEWLDKLSTAIDRADSPSVELDWGNVERISFEAAGNFSAWASRHREHAQKLKLTNANAWVVATLNMLNVLEKIKVGKRKV